MPRVPIRIPSDEWGTTAVKLQLWLIEIGDEVDAGDAVGELSIPGMIGELVAPATGRIVELQAISEQSWSTGDIVGWIETNETSEVSEDFGSLGSAQ